MRGRTYNAGEGRSQEGRGCLFLEFGKRQMGGGQNGSCNFGGRGGQSFSSVRPPKPVLEGSERKWDWSGLCPFPLRIITGREQTAGGGKRIIGGGGPKSFFGEGFYGMSSPLLSFPPVVVFL